MILAGWLMVPDPHAGVRLERGHLTIRDGRIAEVGAGEPIFAADLGGEHAIIMPGFIDAHLHLPQFDSIGVDGMTLLDWLDGVIFPAEVRWEDSAYAEAMTQRVVDQLLRYGTTSFAAYATVHHAATRAAMDTIARAGLCAIVGQVLMDRNAPAELVRPCDQLLAEASSHERCGRVQPAITPRFAISCTGELLEGAGRLAKKSRWPVQTHLAEMEPECALVGELFDGLSYTEVYERAGLLGARSVLAHGIWLDEPQIARLAATRSIIAHCPTANLFLGSGSMDRVGLIDAGVPIVLGSDVAGGPDRSMVRVARAMLETARWRGDQPPTAADCWAQITRRNAEALGMGEVGRIEPGMMADLLVIEPDVPLPLSHEATGDALATLLYAWDDRWIRQTLIAGDVAYCTPME